MAFAGRAARPPPRERTPHSVRATVIVSGMGRGRIFPQLKALTMPEPASGARQRAAEVLPASLPPRGLSRAQAAAYVGISPSLFDQMVRDGRMPTAKRINGRVVWDRRRVDEMFDALDDCGENPWDKA